MWFVQLPRPHSTHCARVKGAMRPCNTRTPNIISVLRKLRSNCWNSPGGKAFGLPRESHTVVGALAHLLEQRHTPQSQRNGISYVLRYDPTRKPLLQRTVERYYTRKRRVSCIIIHTRWAQKYTILTRSRLFFQFYGTKRANSKNLINNLITLYAGINKYTAVQYSPQSHTSTVEFYSCMKFRVSCIRVLVAIIVVYVITPAVPRGVLYTYFT